MTDQPKVEVPSPEQLRLAHAKDVAVAFRDIAGLLKECVFPGCQAARVANAIRYLEGSADAAEGNLAQVKAEVKREKKALKFKKPKVAAAAPAAEGEPNG